MPRTTIARRKRDVLEDIVSANDTVRAAAGILRRSKTDAFGNERPFTVEDVERCIEWLERAQRSYDNAITRLTYLKNDMEQRKL